MSNEDCEARNPRSCKSSFVQVLDLASVGYCAWGCFCVFCFEPAPTCRATECRPANAIAKSAAAAHHDPRKRRGPQKWRDSSGERTNATNASPAGDRRRIVRDDGGLRAKISGAAGQDHGRLQRGRPGRRRRAHRRRSAEQQARTSFRGREPRRRQRHDRGRRGRACGRRRLHDAGLQLLHHHAQQDAVQGYPLRPGKGLRAAHHRRVGAARAGGQSGEIPGRPTSTPSPISSPRQRLRPARLPTARAATATLPISPWSCSARGPASR
ncbi:hypothetical protein ACVWZV_008014 [Bradyrhizobium sp. GM5.1]